MFGLVLLGGLVALAVVAGRSSHRAPTTVPPPPPVPGSAAVVPPMPPPLDYGRPALLSRENLRAMSVTSLESYIRQIEASGLNVIEGAYANSLASARQELGSRL